MQREVRVRRRSGERSRGSRLDAQVAPTGGVAGVPERRIVTRYAVRNSLAPTIQAISATAQWLLGGIFVVEVLFAYPGVGNALVTAVQVRDVPVIQAIAMLLALAFILINLVADIVTILVDPRLRTAA